jgi:hypothetical protein
MRKSRGFTDTLPAFFLGVLPKGIMAMFPQLRFTPFSGDHKWTSLHYYVDTREFFLAGDWSVFFFKTPAFGEKMAC